jgi:hypothetical protein
MGAVPRCWLGNLMSRGLGTMGLTIRCTRSPNTRAPGSYSSASCADPGAERQYRRDEWRVRRRTV